MADNMSLFDVAKQIKSDMESIRRMAQMIKKKFPETEKHVDDIEGCLNNMIKYDVGL